MVLTCIVYTCSVGHAASNFPQYEEYGFPAHYPAFMKGPVPTSKNILVTEGDILQALPNRHVTLDIMTVTKILSSKGTNSLGDFEVQYIFDPRAIPVVNKWLIQGEITLVDYNTDHRYYEELLGQLDSLF